MKPQSYLPTGLPIPVPDADGLTAPFWEGLREEKLKVQKCGACRSWIWGPEWICHRCHSFDVQWVDVTASGRIYSWERVWQPSSQTMQPAVPYLVVLVELDCGDNLRLVGNLLGPTDQDVQIGMKVKGVFEHHNASEPPFSLLQWEKA